MVSRWHDPGFDDDDPGGEEQAERIAEEQEEEEALALEQEVRDLQALGAWEGGLQQDAVRERIAKAIRKAEQRINVHLARARNAARAHHEDADKAVLRAGRLLRAAKPGLRGKAWRTWLEREVGVYEDEAVNWYREARPPKRRKFRS